MAMNAKNDNGITLKISSTKLLNASGAMLVAQIFMVVTNLLSVSLLGRSLEVENFGMWMIFTSFIPIFGMLDFGLGQALRNKLSSMAVNRKIDTDLEEQKQFFSVFLFLTLLATILTLFFLFANSSVSWMSTLNETNSRLNTLGVSLEYVVFTCLSISIPFSLHSVALLAYQMVYWRSLFEVMHCFLLLGIIYLDCFFYNSFANIVITYYVFMTILVFIRTIVFCKIKHWKFRLLSFKLQVENLKGLMKTGINFWLIGIGTNIILSVGPIIAGKVTGVSEAGEFGMFQKLFILLLSVQSTMLIPLWSAYTQAACSENWQWIEKILRKSIIVTVVLFVCAGGLIIFMHQYIFSVWIGRELYNLPLVCTQAIWILLYGCYCCYAMLLNGLGYLKQQSIVIVLSGVFVFPIGVYLGSRYGLVGISFGYIIVTLPLLISSALKTRDVLKTKTVYPNI